MQVFCYKINLLIGNMLDEKGTGYKRYSMEEIFDRKRCLMKRELQSIKSQKHCTSGIRVFMHFKFIRAFIK
jgi:hypothetical protein